MNYKRTTKDLWKEKVINDMSNGKVMIARLIAELIKKTYQISVILLIAIPLYKNASMFSETVWTIWWRY